jgi:hypothetical protein
MAKDSKAKTIQLGAIKKGKYGAFLSFDPSIKEITIKREFESKGDTITQVLKVPVNEQGYLAPCNIAKIEDDFNFRVSKGWVKEDDAERAMEKLKSSSTPTTSFVSVKVES